MSAPCSTLDVPQKQLTLRGPDIKPDIAIKPGGSKRNEEFQRRLLITAQHTHQHSTKLTPPQSHPDHDRIFDQKRLEWMAVGWTYLAMIAPACMEDRTSLWHTFRPEQLTDLVGPTIRVCKSATMTANSNIATR